MQYTLSVLKCGKKSQEVAIATVIAILQVAACSNETCSGASCIRSWFVKKGVSTSCEPGYDIRDIVRLTIQQMKSSYI